MNVEIEINKNYLIDHHTKGKLKVKVLAYEGSEWVQVRILKSNRKYDNIYHDGESGVGDKIVIQKSLAIWQRWKKEFKQLLIEANKEKKEDEIK